MSRFGGLSEERPSVFKTQASLVLIYRPNVAGMKDRVDLAQPVNRTPDLWSNVADDLLRKVDDMIESNWCITIDGVAEELGIGHERSQKMQSPEFFLEGFLKPINRHEKCLNVLCIYVEK
ncbi:hypothetical protein TNCV_2811491 [Trichonephila clavipes]|nr:hypothetical protein TNCV_2811491 [Trichonephila clavipes]